MSRALTNSERVAAWKSKHKPKRKVAELPHELAMTFENKLRSDGISYQKWLIICINKYLKEEKQ